MSECNPQCGPGESWADGECRAPLAASAKTLTNTIVIEGGLIAQFVDDEFAAVALAGGPRDRRGDLSDQPSIFARPRLTLAIGEATQIEPSIDLGYNLRLGTFNGGVSFALVLGLWPVVSSSPLGPYVGLEVRPHIELGRIGIGLALEHGRQLAPDTDLRVSTVGVNIL